MYKDPLFSILIPVYNKKKYLKNCIESVKNQSLKDFEILFIDDCSTDGGRELLEEFVLRASNSRLRIIKNDVNQGLSNNRNILISNARGRYVIFLDSDDSISDDLLLRLTEYTDKGIDMIRYQINLINEKKGKDLERFNDDNVGKIMSGEEALTHFSSNHVKKYALACAYCVRRNFLIENSIRFPHNARLHEDLATWPIAIAHAKSIAIIDYRGYNYYRNDDSLTRNIDKITDSAEYMKKIFSNQQEFLHAIQIAIRGVLESSISSKAKDICIEDLYVRLDIYNKAMNQKLSLLHINENHLNGLVK